MTPMPKSREDLEISMRVIAHLRHQMEVRGLNETEMAKRLGISQPGLNRILSGERGVSGGLLLRIHRRLSVPGDVLLGETPGRKPSPSRPGSGPPN